MTKMATMPVYGKNSLKYCLLWNQKPLVLAPADNAANNVVVVRKRYYIKTLKQKLSTAKTYEHNRLDETTIVDRH